MRYRHPALAPRQLLGVHLPHGPQLLQELLRQLDKQLPLTVDRTAAVAQADLGLDEDAAELFELEFQETFRPALAYAIAHEVQARLSCAGHDLALHAQLGKDGSVLLHATRTLSRAAALPWHHPEAVL